MLSPRSRTALLFFALCEVVALSRTTSAYVLNGYRWPSGSQVAMHLQLDRPIVQLQDGSLSWNASAADALGIWNQSLDKVQFVQADASSASPGDGANSIFFSNDIYGDTFGASVLAVTLNYSQRGSGYFTETDVIFNNLKKWNSYRGPIQGAGNNATWDFHRVALHEFGHVLGLDHPDEHGQPGLVAIMNSIISDLDHLADDDVAGVMFLYKFRITTALGPYTAVAGNFFQYRIEADNQPLSYDAIGLPAGLLLDSNTGSISGRPSQAGNFAVLLVAHGVSKDASATFQINVLASQITSSLLAGVLVGDPFTYQITALNRPFAFDVAGLPDGLSLDRDTGLISGMPTAIGTFTVTVTIHCGFGDASANIFITVRPFGLTSSLIPIPSPQLGSDFKYQITGNNTPSSYSAVDLPSGLELDTVTGLISGNISLSGTYQFTAIAHGAKGDAAGIVHISVPTPLPSQSKPAGAIKTFDVSAARLVFDPLRSRLYASDQSAGAITVIDAVSLSALSVIKLPHVPYGISMSADNSRLWIACSEPNDYSDGWIAAIDLNNLQVLPVLRLSQPLSEVVEGPNNRLYASGQGQTLEVDGNSGALLGTLYPSSGFLVASKDRNTLYVGSFGSSGMIWMFDISQVKASLREQTDFNTRGEGGSSDLKLSHNGDYLCFAEGLGNERVRGLTSTALMPAASVRTVLGNFINNPNNVVNFVGPVAFSNDDVLFYQAAYDNTYEVGGGTHLEIFDIASFSKIGAIELGRPPGLGGPTVRDLSVDNTNAYIFVATDVSGHTGQLRVYSTGRGVPPLPPPVPAHSILNVSTRVRIDTGDNAAIGGFIINGSAPKRVMIRAVGPSLSKLGVAGAIANPALELHDATGKLLAQNDNWNSHRAEVLASALAPMDERESALLVTLRPGSYTAVVFGVGASTGVALVEVYDLSDDGGSQLANISTRGKVEAGDNVMIGGFIIGGDQPTNVVIRAIGPSLADHAVVGALADPMLEVHDGNGGLLAQDDDWRMYQEQPLTDSGLAPTDDRESAMILQLQPGSYTAIVRGKDSTTGVGLVEVYNLDAN